MPLLPVTIQSSGYPDQQHVRNLGQHCRTPRTSGAIRHDRYVSNRRAWPASGRQFANALGTAAFQTGSVLSVFPNAATSLAPQLQSAFFGTAASTLSRACRAPVFFNGFSGVFPHTGTGRGGFAVHFHGVRHGISKGIYDLLLEFYNSLNNFFRNRPTGTGGTTTLPTGVLPAWGHIPRVSSDPNSPGAASTTGSTTGSSAPDRDSPASALLSGGV